jgi:hypothetical protein
MLLALGFLFEWSLTTFAGFGFHGAFVGWQFIIKGEK